MFDLSDNFKIVEHTIKLNHFQKLVKFEVSQMLGCNFNSLQTDIPEAIKKVHKERLGMSVFKAGRPSHIEMEADETKKEIHFFHLKYPSQYRQAEVEPKKVRLFSVVPI